MQSIYITEGYWVFQEESHSRNVSRKSSLKSIPESEEELDNYGRRDSDNNDTYTRSIHDNKRSENQTCSKSSLDLLFNSGKQSIPLKPPVVQVLSPGASTPKKSFSSDEYIINSTSNDNNRNEEIVTLRGDIGTLTDKVT